MLKKHLWIILIIGTVAAVSFIFGCSGRTPFDKHSGTNRNWGKSYDTAIYSQLLNPDADKNLDPVLGLDGTGSEYNVAKYKESFKKAEPKEIVNILKLQ